MSRRSSLHSFPFLFPFSLVTSLGPFSITGYHKTNCCQGNFKLICFHICPCRRVDRFRNGQKLKALPPSFRVDSPGFNLQPKPHSEMINKVLYSFHPRFPVRKQLSCPNPSQICRLWPGIHSHPFTFFNPSPSLFFSNGSRSFVGSSSHLVSSPFPLLFHCLFCLVHFHARTFPSSLHSFSSFLSLLRSFTVYFFPKTRRNW